MTTGINYQPYIAYTPNQIPKMQQPAQFQPAAQYPAGQYPVQNSTPLSHIPPQPDVLSLSTKSDINIDSKPELQTQKMQAQMPAPDIQTNKELPQTQNTKEEITEKPLPSLNIGVVDAPNNASLTPITDDLNSRAQDIKRTNAPEIQKTNSSPVPAALGKKPLGAGKLSAYLTFGSLGLISVMVIPKGISKIVKLIKHK